MKTTYIKFEIENGTAITKVSDEYRMIRSIIQKNDGLIIVSEIDLAFPHFSETFELKPETNKEDYEYYQNLYASYIAATSK